MVDERPARDRTAKLSDARGSLLKKRMGGKMPGFDQAPVISKRASMGPPLLSFTQQRLWYMDQLEPNLPVYNLPVAFRLKGELDISTLATGAHFK